MPTTRITISIPGDLVTQADEKAKELDRSRSWILAEAVRKYLAEPEPAQPERQPLTGKNAVRETAYPYVVHGLDSQRLAQLRADLELDPGERVRAAEDAARSGRRSPIEPATDQVITFRSIEDFHRWERREALSRLVQAP